MVNRNLLRGLDEAESEWEVELKQVLDPKNLEDMDWGASAGRSTKSNRRGRILRIEKEMVLVDVGYKSEGVIPLNEWEEHEEPPQPGQVVRVLIEELEDGNVKSKTRA